MAKKATKRTAAQPDPSAPKAAAKAEPTNQKNRDGDHNADLRERRRGAPSA
jgi:hypothetical protein